MTKFILTLAMLFYFSSSFSQWTKVTQLPSFDILSLYQKDNILYAGGKNRIYLTRDKGQTWDSTNIIPLFSTVDNIIIYKNELYATSFSKGVFKSPDGGNSWQNVSAGIFPEVSDLCEFKGNLYASTLGNSMFKLDSVNRSSWQSFNNGLSNLSANNTSLAANSNAMIAGTLANGLYDHLPANSTQWEERFLLGQIRPSEGTYDIVTGHDSLFLSGHSGRFYMSMDNGLNWNLFGNIISSLHSKLVNARQALLLSRVVFDGVRFNTSFFYIKKDSLQNAFVPFSFVADHLTWKLEIFGNKLWDASSRGLFFMSLSNLPGISTAEDSSGTILPVQFNLFNAKCEGNKILLNWKTAQEQNSDHFNIEKSIDGINWTVIGNIPAAGNSNIERAYSFTDNDPVQNSFYRIAELDRDGRVQYTGILRPSCDATDLFSLWPNPAHDIVFINIVTGSASQATIKIFDSKGALVKRQSTTVLPGSNRISTDIRSLQDGSYFLSIEWNNGQEKKTVQVLKQ